MANVPGSDDYIEEDHYNLVYTFDVWEPATHCVMMDIRIDRSVDRMAAREVLEYISLRMGERFEPYRHKVIWRPELIPWIRWNLNPVSCSKMLQAHIREVFARLRDESGLGEDQLLLDCYEVDNGELALSMDCYEVDGPNRGSMDDAGDVR
jgi:hypothetical protein